MRSDGWELADIPSFLHRNGVILGKIVGRPYLQLKHHVGNTLPNQCLVNFGTNHVRIYYQTGYGCYPMGKERPAGHLPGCRFALQTNE